LTESGTARVQLWLHSYGLLQGIHFNPGPPGVGWVCID
jgi:hypothetical protein